MPNGKSSSGTERSLKERVKCKLHGHDWKFNWADRRKGCYRCGAEKGIEKEYSHEDKSAEIGETKIVVEERDRGSPYRIERKRYRNTASGPDDAHFQWFPDGGFYADEDGLSELRNEIARTLQSDTDRSGDSNE